MPAISVSGWQVNAAVALVALTAIVALCGLVAPTLDFSPVMRRRVEVIEFVAIALVFPQPAGSLASHVFRELRICKALRRCDRRPVRIGGYAVMSDHRGLPITSPAGSDSITAP